MNTQKVTPHLWFDREAEDAAAMYVDIFSHAPHAQGESRILNVSRYGKEGFEVHKMPEGTAMTVELLLDGQRFLALNGGPIFTFNESVSFMIDCDDQEEVDYFWDKLSAVPESEQCGWLKDKFGLSWQVVPKQLGEMMSNPDAEKAGRVMNAMLQMKKIEVSKLEEAFEGK